MTKVALVDVDSRIPNLALMKVSAWHKAQGDSVKFYEPIACPDCGATLNTNWRHCPECGDWREL